MEQKNEKSTTDVYFAAALMSLGAITSRIDRTDPRHMIFTLTNPLPPEGTGVFVDIDFQEVENQWISGTLVVNAQQFKEAIQRMKSSIHSR